MIASALALPHRDAGESQPAIVTQNEPAVDDNNNGVSSAWYSGKNPARLCRMRNKGSWKSWWSKQFSNCYDTYARYPWVRPCTIRKGWRRLCCRIDGNTGFQVHCKSRGGIGTWFGQEEEEEEQIMLS